MSRTVLLSAMLAIAAIAAGVAADSYDATIAERAVYYSAAAYSDDPAGCMTSKYTLTELTKFSGQDSGGNPIFGFSAVNPDLNEIVVAFRGTAGSYQLFLEIVSASKFEPVDPAVPGAKVVSYFSSAAEQLSDQFTDAIIKLAVAYPDYPLLFTGHSLGAALTSLASVAMRNTFQGMSPALNPKILLYTFGQPRVGNSDYSALHDSLGITSFRIIHNRDIVAHVPPCAESDFKCKQVPGSDDAYHHGTEVFYPDFNNGGKLCTGSPIDEDATCSNSQIDLSIDDHLIYFNIHVGDYCSSGYELPENGLDAALPNNS